MLTREEFEKQDGLKRREFEIPGIGPVLMRELSVAERVAEGAGSNDDDTAAMRMIAMSLCQPDGSPMFGADEIDRGVIALTSKSLDALQELQKAFLAVCGMDEAAAIEAVGNSTGTRNDASSSGSAETSDTPAPDTSPST